MYNIRKIFAIAAIIGSMAATVRASNDVRKQAGMLKFVEALRKECSHAGDQRACDFLKQCVEARSIQYGRLRDFLGVSDTFLPKFEQRLKTYANGERLVRMLRRATTELAVLRVLTKWVEAAE